MRVALVHDWLVGYRGGERVLDALVTLFPEAEIFTLLHRPGTTSARIDSRPIHTSFLQSIPGIFERYRTFLPLMPRAIESFDLRGFDFILSSSHCVAKGVRVPEGVPHLSYVHAPMRYMWDLFEDYFAPGRASPAVRTAALLARPFLKRWDRATASGVNAFVANSHHVAQKIARFYGRASHVIPPPVELPRFAAVRPALASERKYFLWVGAFAPYKRLDLVLEAFRARKGPEPLFIVGSGQDAARLTDLPPNVQVLGPVADAALPELYRNARALLFPGEEDFGLTPLEAQACGTPVVAFGRGGALETVTPETGIFFPTQTVEALTEALDAVPAFLRDFDPREAQAQARRFSPKRFLEQISREVSRLF